jgi:hypothetical protein
MDINLLATPRRRHFNPLDSSSPKSPRGKILKSALSRGGGSGDPANIAYPARSSDISEAMLGVEAVGKLSVAVGHGNPNTVTIDGGIEVDVTDMFESGTASTQQSDNTYWTGFGWSCQPGRYAAAWARSVQSGDMTDNKAIYLPRGVGNNGRGSALVFVYENPVGKSFSSHVAVSNWFQKRIIATNALGGADALTQCKITKDDGYPFVSTEYYIAVSGFSSSTETTPTGTNYHYFSSSDVNSEGQVKATKFWKESPGAQYVIGLQGSSYNVWSRSPASEFRIVIGPGDMFMNQEIGANGFWNYTVSGTARQFNYFVSVARINYV